MLKYYDYISTVNLDDAAKKLGMSSKRLRKYIRLGYFKEFASVEYVPQERDKRIYPIYSIHRIEFEKYLKEKNIN